MTHEEFKAVVGKRQANTLETLTRKAYEYAPGTDDRLVQFKKIAAFRGICAEEVLAGLMVKHISALFDYIDMFAAGEDVSLDWWDEKIGDTINYLHLLEGILIERRNDRQGGD